MQLGWVGERERERVVDAAGVRDERERVIVCVCV